MDEICLGEDLQSLNAATSMLHGTQMWSSDENSVCPSVCLAVKRMNCDKTEEKSVHIFIPYK